MVVLLKYFFNQFMKMLRPRIIFQFIKDHLTIMKSVFVRGFFLREKAILLQFKNQK